MSFDSDGYSSKDIFVKIIHRDISSEIYICKNICKKYRVIESH